MNDESFRPGDRVDTPGAGGTVIDVRPTPAGRWVFGVEDASGTVTYYTPGALRHASG